jgi:hypothetical protein
MKKNRLLIFLLPLLTISLLGANKHIIGTSYTQASHDVAVTSIAPSVTSARLGDLVDISVVVENQGTAAENFTVTAYYDTTTIETQPITDLQPSLNTTLVFTWNTTGLRETIYATDVKEKSYTIKATATTVPGETETQDNELVSPNPVRVVMQYIAVIPQCTVNASITPNMNYTISIYTDYNGTDIWSWQFSLSYNPIILEGIEVRNGDLITTAKHPDATFTSGNFDNTRGELDLTVGYFPYVAPPPPTTSGPGTLAYVTFRVKDTGESGITLTEETKLLGPDPLEIINDYSPFFDHILHGSFRNTEAQIIHDIAVIRVEPYPTSVTRGESVNVTVVVENQGTETENFEVRLYSDYNPPYTAEIIGAPRPVFGLAANANKTLRFTWNTTNVSPKNYTLTAVVPELDIGETDKDNNILPSTELVTVKEIPGTPIPVTEIIIGIVIVIAVIAVIAILRRRRRKPLPE